MVFGRREDFEKYKRRVSREYVIKALSLKTLIFLFLMTAVSVVCAWLDVLEYGSFTKEAYVSEFFSYGLLCFTCSWFARGIIRLKRVKGIIKLIIICSFAFVATLAVMLLNELYLYIPFIHIFPAAVYFRDVVGNLLHTDVKLWAIYFCIFLTTVLTGFYISTDWFGNLYKRFLESRLLGNFAKKVSEIFSPVTAWIIKMFSVTDEYDEEKDETHENIYVTGDLHGDVTRIETYNKLRKNNIIKTGDYIAVCGDFGFLFSNDDAEKNILDEFERNSDYNILFVDGNHENFKAINSYPVENWNGGKVHRIRKNILHLMRGQVYEINGLKVFAMGGAYSIDRYLRKKDLSYWEEEIPVNEEYREASENLDKHSKKVDIILTHTAPDEIIRRLGYDPDGHDAELTGFFQWVLHEVDFKKWYFGHWHEDKKFPGGCRALYYDLVKVNSEYEINIKEELVDCDVL